MGLLVISMNCYQGMQQDEWTVAMMYPLSMAKILGPHKPSHDM